MPSRSRSKSKRRAPPSRDAPLWSLPSFVAGAVAGTVLVAAFITLGDRYFEPLPGIFVDTPDLESDIGEMRFAFYDTLSEVSLSTDDDPPTRLEPPPDNTAESASGSQDTGQDEPGSGRSNNANSQQEVPLQTVGYVLQAGSFTLESHAHAFQASLILDGFQAHTTAIELNDGRQMYRVIIGPYTERADAERDEAKLKLRNISAMLLAMRERSG